jgi:plastocyanin
MNLKSFSLLALVAALAIVFAGCAQDSTDTTDDNPAMQEQVMKGTAAEGASAAAGASDGAMMKEDKTDTSSTDTTRSPATGGTHATKVALSADPSGALKYSTTKLNTNAGNVTVAFENKSSTPHDVTITGSGNKKLGATKQITGSSANLNLKDVKPGTYTFFCSVPGHEQAGMKGTLTVK